MDMITIWLQRIGGKPIQVFTGYLDSVPYLQGYPDNITLDCTCTLKKIAYTWFDPGLDFYLNILRDSGWTVDPTTGTVQTPTGKNLFQTGGGAFNDGNFGKVLYEFLVQICNWNSNNVYISNLPPDLPAVAAKMYKNLSVGTEQDLNTLEATMKQVMGVSVVGGSTNADGTLSSNLEAITRVVKAKADAANISLRVMIAAATILTGYDPTYYQTHDQNATNWGYGLFALRPSLSSSGNEGTQISGHSIKDILEVGLSSELFARKLLGSPKALLKGANNGNLNDAFTVIKRATGIDFPKNTFTTAWKQAEQWANTYNNSSPLNNSVNPTNAPTLSTKHLTWADSEITGLFNAREKTIFTSDYVKNINDILAPYYFYMKKSVGGVELSKRNKTTFDASTMLLSTNKSGATGTAAIQKAFNALVGKKSPSYVIAVDDTGHTRIMHNGRPMNGNGVTNTLVQTLPSNTLLIQVPKGTPYPTWDGQKTQSTTTTKNPDPAAPSTISSTGITFQDLAKISLDSAFVGQLAFPFNYIESHTLTGERALMNDISCLDAVEQLCASSMRSFMSLPNGKFLAFYPDYFGGHGREPYWPIFDIEMTDLSVYLNDAQLATHVYVVGDTFSMGSPDLAIFNTLETEGVATLTMASILEGLMVPFDNNKHGKKNQKETSWGRLKDAYAFLNHYGARPLVLQEPLIRNTFYEFLYAWQKFEQQWAATFNTNVSFTFQPEVMAGGLISFPQHNLQVFVESVTHTFDYTQGFFTQAQISSPAALKDNGLGVASIPGFALAGGVVTVGT